MIHINTNFGFPHISIYFNSPKKQSMGVDDPPWSSRPHGHGHPASLGLRLARGAQRGAGRGGVDAVAVDGHVAPRAATVWDGRTARTGGDGDEMRHQMITYDNYVNWATNHLYHIS